MMSERIRCPFEKAILSTFRACENATQYQIGERTGVECGSHCASEDCFVLLRHLRDASRFALKVTDTSRELPFGKEMKILFGGLTGLQEILGEPGGATAGDVHKMVSMAKERYGTLEDLPYSELVKYIAAFRQGRRSGPQS